MKQRLFLIIFSFIALALATAIRLSFSIAIIEMIKPKSNVSQNCSATTCGKSEVEGNEHQMDWNENAIGIIIAAYSIGWIFVQIPIGIMVDLQAAKYLCGIGMILTSVVTLFLPLAAHSDSSFNWMIVVRCVIGVFEAPLFCGLNSIISKWFPNDEIWFASGIIYSGIPFGGILSSLCTGYAIYQSKKWSRSFQILGIMGIVVYSIFVLIVFDEPGIHPCITIEEKEYLDGKLRNKQRAQFTEIPWRGIFSNYAFIAVVIARFGIGFGFNILINYMPHYFSSVLCLGLFETFMYTAIAFACAFLIGIFASIFVYWQIKRRFSRTFMRKVFFAISSIGSCIFVMVASFCNCDKIGVVISLSLAMCCMGLYVIVIYTNEVVLSKMYCGTLTGITNTVSGIVDTIGPFIVDAVIKRGSLKEWQLMFWISVILFNACSMPYILWASHNEQGFDQGPPVTSPRRSTIFDNIENQPADCIYL